MQKKLIPKHQGGGRFRMSLGTFGGYRRVPSFLDKNLPMSTDPRMTANNIRHTLTQEPNSIYDARMEASSKDVRGDYPNTNSLMFDVMYRDRIGINSTDRENKTREGMSTMPIVDNRNITSTEKMGRNVNPRTVNLLIGGARTRGLDPATVLAMGLQETGLSSMNPLHYNRLRLEPAVMEKSNNWDIEGHAINSSLDYLKEKQAYAKQLGKRGEADTIQAWNGYGKVGGDWSVSKSSPNAKMYGIPTANGPIDMNTNPVYGNRILDIRENVIKKNPQIQKLINNGR